SRHRIDAWDSEPYTGLFGQTTTFPNIAGHRQVGQTACPGNGLFRQLDGVRGSVRSLAGSFPPNPIDMSKAIRYRNLAPITPDTPSGNDVRPGAQKTNAGSTAATVSLGTLVGVRVLSSGGNLTTLGSKAQKYGSPAQRGANGTVAITPGPQQS